MDHTPKFSHLNKPLLKDETTRQGFLEWVHDLDSIEITIIDRGQYANRKQAGDDHILVADTTRPETETTPQGYGLYLPEDLSYLEAIHIAYIVEKYLGAEKGWKSVEAICSAVKTNLAFLLRMNEVTQEDVEEYKRLSGLSEEILKRIEQAKFSAPAYKQALHQHEQFFEKNERKEGIAPEMAEKRVETFIEKGLDEVFWERGLETTLEFISNVSPQKEDEEPETNYIYKDLIACFKIKDLLDLKHKKHVLGTLRKHIKNTKPGKLLGDLQSTLYSFEKRCTEEILFHVQKIAYSAENSASIKKTLITKEAQCLLKSVIGHVFLEELKISHDCSSMPQHTALIVYVGKHVYRFEGTCNIGQLLDITYKSLERVGCAFAVFNDHIGKKEYFIPRETKSSLMAQILLNKAIDHLIVEPANMVLAEHYLRKAIELDSLLRSAYNSLAGIYHEEQKYDLAKMNYQVALDIFPQQSGPRVQLGQIEEKSGDNETALSNYTRAIVIGEKGKELGHFYRGELHQKLGNLQEAIDDLIEWYNYVSTTKKVQSQAPEIAERILSLYFDTKQYTQGIIFANNHLHEFGQNAWVLAVRGDCYRMTNNNEEALIDCDNATEINPTLAYPYIIRAEIYTESGQYNRAKMELVHSIKISPLKEFTYTALIKLLMDKKDTNKRLRIFLYMILSNIQKFLTKSLEQASFKDDMIFLLEAISKKEVRPIIGSTNIEKALQHILNLLNQGDFSFENSHEALLRILIADQDSLINETLINVQNFNLQP